MNCQNCDNKLNGQGYFKDYFCKDCIKLLNEAENERKNKLKHEEKIND